MNEHKGMNIFGVITAVLLLVVNLCHGLWTCWLTVEQIQTGWGYGTDMEMLAILPLLVEAFSIPMMVTGVVYLVMSCWKRHQKVILGFNIVLFSMAAVQYLLTNLFLYF